MQEFVIGQRWISAAELQLGLGMVIEIEHRTVSIVFPGDRRDSYLRACGCAVDAGAFPRR